MGITVNAEDAERVRAKAAGFFAGWAEDLAAAGEAGKEAIVRTTLAGIGDKDQGFAPYSPRYRELIDSVGGKPQQVVNLRGLFYHDGQKRKRYRSEARRQAEREGRRAWVGVAFASLTSGIRSFQGRTGTTRPALGVKDPRSEMSTDLVQVEATDEVLHLTYVPRAKAYMVWHHEGRAGRAPARPWFSADKRAVWAAMMRVLRVCLQARAQRFNDASATAVDVQQAGGAAAGEAAGGAV